jgi:acetoin utilization protein AcuB
MTKNPVTIGSNEPVSVAVAKMKAGNFRRLPVVDNGKLIGIISEFDLHEQNYLSDSILVRQLMTRDPITIPPSATLEAAVRLLSSHKIGALPVVESGRLVGIISARDLLMPEPRPLDSWIPRWRLGLAGRIRML